MTALGHAEGLHNNLAEFWSLENAVLAETKDSQHLQQSDGLADPGSKSKKILWGAWNMKSFFI